MSSTPADRRMKPAGTASVPQRARRSAEVCTPPKEGRLSAAQADGGTPKRAVAGCVLVGPKRSSDHDGAGPVICRGEDRDGFVRLVDIGKPSCQEAP
jgi:hypothetical protein